MPRPNLEEVEGGILVWACAWIRACPCHVFIALKGTHFLFRFAYSQEQLEKGS